MATRYGKWCALMSLYLARMVDGGGGVRLNVSTVLRM